MPKFDIQCKKCNTVIEIVLTVYKDAMKKPCELCNCVTVWETQAPLTNMQPDKYWSGQVTPHAGYVTSGSFLKRFEKQNHLEKVDRSVYEEAQKKSANRHSEMVKKNKENTIKFLEKELAPVEISPDGTTVKEQKKFIKDRT